MELKDNKPQVIGIVIGIMIILVSWLFVYLDKLDSSIFYFISGIALVIAGFPFFTNLLIESAREKSLDSMFLEFARDLVEGVKSGTPISKSIINVRGKNYGSLTVHVEKLANQISIGIPVKDALDTFGRDVNSEVINRAISLIREAERSGGRIEVILESVSFSMAQIEKLKKERKAAIYGITVQGYIIVFIFIIIMLIMEFKIIPMISNLSLDTSSPGYSSSAIDTIGQGSLDARLSPENFAKPFLFLLLFQGFFAGLVIGKISEGTLKAGLKHSFVLVSLSWLISTGANIFLNSAAVRV
jgi:flagellar protein FlaJ